MSRHHYIPVSVLSRFASIEAWKVVSASREVKDRIAQIDSETIASARQRNWPLCVYEKENRRFTRKLVKQVCSQAGFYGVLDYNDTLTRAMIRSLLQADLLDPRSSIGSFDEFMKLGQEPLDPELIERTRIGEIDEKFARVLPLLRDGQRLNDDQIAIVQRFVAFARFRTPVWRRIYYPEAYDRQLKRLKQKIHLLSQSAEDFDKEWGISLQTLNGAIDHHFYHMAMVISCSNNHALNGAKILVLHAIAVKICFWNLSGCWCRRAEFGTIVTEKSQAIAGSFRTRRPRLIYRRN